MINLQEREWKSFELGSLFNIYTGGDMILSRLEKGEIPVISHSINNNGVATYTKEIKGKRKFDCNRTISLADRGNFYAHVQGVDFYIGTRVKALEFIGEACNKEILKFICPLINSQAVKFSYGNNCCDNTDSLIILLPVDWEGNPDYKFMEEYIKQLEVKQLNEYKKYAEYKLKSIVYKEIPKLDEKVWKSFYFRDIFSEIKRGKRLTKANQLSGNRPYISSSGENNGVDNFISNSEKVRIYEKCISIANSGTVGKAFYHPYEFVASDHITKLKNKDLTEYMYLFMLPIISRLQEKYNFNREINDKRINREVIMLPVDENNKPDWNYMEQYSKNMIIEQIKEYIDYCKTG